MLSACSSINGGTSILVEPNEISISAALEDIEDGISQMKEKLEKNNQVLGVFPCKIILNLNLTLGKKEENKLVVNFDPVNLDNKLTVDTKRDNSIEFEFYNPGCLPEKTLGYNNPDKIRTVFDGMLIQGGGQDCTNKNLFKLDKVEPK